MDVNVWNYKKYHPYSPDVKVDNDRLYLHKYLQHPLNCSSDDIRKSWHLGSLTQMTDRQLFF